MSFGLGASQFKTDNAGSTTEISGSGIDFAVAVGGAVTDHLVIYGELGEAATFDNPTVKMNGESIDSSGNVAFFSVGPGVAYYFGESNYFVSGSLSISQLSFENLNLTRTQNESQAGISFRALFGKEWWVSDNWGLGMSLALTFGSVKDKYLETNNTTGNTPTWTTAAFSLLFSATYN